MEQNSYFLWIAVSLSMGGWGWHSPANAQIISDETLPINSIVNPQNNTFQIDGGTLAGTNLFHSFQDFSLPTGSEAFFNNALTVENIITRVTGSNISTIDGLIRANGTANLFLLNPNGIVFGANARLDIGGSFLSSTADRVQFNNGSFFSATDTATTPPLLTINVPIGLQFGAQPGGIRVEGAGSNIIDPKGQSILRDDRTLGLQVRPERTLALVGGNIDLIGGNLTAAGDITHPGGRIELGSVDGNNTVSLTPISEGWRLGYAGVQDFQDIHLMGVPAPGVYQVEGSSLDVSGSRSGTILIWGESIYVQDGSAVLALTLGSESAMGDAISVRASNLLEVSGKAEPKDTSQNSPLEFVSSQLSSTVWLNAFGQGRNLTIDTPRLEVANEAFIATGTLGLGDAGDLTITATEVDLSAGRLFARSSEESMGGNGGTISINTDRLTVRDRGQISTSAESSGRGGDVKIHARQLVEVITENTPNARDVSAIRATVNPNQMGMGHGGNIDIITDRLHVLGGSSISTTTLSFGDAGNITIHAREIQLRGETLVTNSRGVPGIRPSQIAAQVNPNASGNGGTIDIETDRLLVADGARIAATTQGSGNAGVLDIDADEIELIGMGTIRDPNTNDFKPSRLEARAEQTGNNDNIRIPEGAPGNIRVEADRLFISDGARILTEDQGTSAENRMNRDDLGKITLNISDIRLRNGSEITTRAGVYQDGNLIRNKNGEVILSNGGNIEIETETLTALGNSNITANASGTGGNITIETETLTALGNSDITANASAKGGNITITTQGIFGTEVREFNTPESDITATGNANSNNTIEIQTPDIDPSTGLLQLPETPIDAASLIGQNPCAKGIRSEFVDRGRGGLPPTPSEVLREQEDSADLLEFPPDWESRAVEDDRNSEAITETPVRQLVEAQGWFVDAQGKVILTANPPTVTLPGSVEDRSRSVSQRESSCQVQ